MGLVSDLRSSSHNPVGSNPCNKSVTPHHIGSSASPAEPGLISLIRSSKRGRHSWKGHSGAARAPGLRLFQKSSPSCSPMICTLFWIFQYALFPRVFLSSAAITMLILFPKHVCQAPEPQESAGSALSPLSSQGLAGPAPSQAP